jgi:hypothetical protein
MTGLSLLKLLLRPSLNPHERRKDRRGHQERKGDGGRDHAGARAKAVPRVERRKPSAQGKGKFLPSSLQLPSFLPSASFLLSFRFLPSFLTSASFLPSSLQLPSFLPHFSFLPSFLPSFTKLKK